MHEPREFNGLLISGCALFAMGLLLGLVYTFVLIGRVEVWPFPWEIGLASVGDVDAWRRAHLGALINAIVVLVFAMAARSAQLPERLWFGFSLCVHSTAWLNSIAFALAALWSVRGLSGGAGLANTAVYLMFLLAVVTAFAQVGLLGRHLLNRSMPG